MFKKINIIGWLMVSFLLLTMAAAAATAGIEEHISKTESGFYYTVQKGDTLWDLSEQFADSPWQWPELWHYNPKIANPHWIYPGQKIMVYEKEWRGKEKQAVEKPAEKPKKSYYHYEMIDSVGFIREPAVTPCGAIFKVHEDKTLISERDRIYISKGDGPPLQTGQLYTVYRTFEPNKRSSAYQDLGIQHYLTGVVAVTNMEGEYAIANVVKAFRDIHEGDKVMPLVKRSPSLEEKASATGLSGKVLHAEERNALIGQYKRIFIDKGESAGVEEGQSYDIYHQELGKPEKNAEPIALKPYIVGKLMVLHTERNTATCLITDSNRTIRPGDQIRCPQ